MTTITTPMPHDGSEPVTPALIEETIDFLGRVDLDTAVFAVDHQGRGRVTVGEALTTKFRWHLVDSAPADLIARSHRDVAIDLFNTVRRNGMASGIIRLANCGDADVELRLFWRDDHVLGVFVDRNSGPAARRQVENGQHPNHTNGHHPNGHATAYTPGGVFAVLAAAGEIGPTSGDVVAPVDESGPRIIIGPPVSPAAPAPAPAEPVRQAYSIFDQMDDIASQAVFDELDLDPEYLSPASTALFPAAETDPALQAAASASVTSDSFIPRRMILHVDRDGTIVDADWATSAALGWPRSEMVGAPLFDWMHPAEIEAGRSSWSEMISRPGSGRRLRSRYWHREGRWLWVEQTDRNLLDDEAAGTVVTELVDITPEIEAHTALETRTRTMAVLSQLATTGLVELDGTGATRFVNEQWFAATSLPVGAPFTQFVGQLLEPERLTTAIRRAVDEDHNSRYEGFCRDGRRVLVRVQPIPSTTGSRHTIIAVDHLAEDFPSAPGFAGVAAPPLTPAPAAAPTVRLTAGQVNPSAPSDAQALNTPVDLPSAGVAPAAQAGAGTTKRAQAEEAFFAPKRTNKTPATKSTTAELRVPSVALAKVGDVPVVAPASTSLSGPQVARTLPSVRPAGGPALSNPQQVSPSNPHLPVLRLAVPVMVPPDGYTPPAGNRPSIVLGPSTMQYSDSVEVAVYQNQTGARATTDSATSRLWSSVGVRELLFLAVIAIAALLVRLWDLTTLPGALLGEEGVTGLEANRVLDDGWIGVYSNGGGGQPAGSFYPTALSVNFFGHSVMAIRVMSAFVGALTVALLYVVARPRYGRDIAVASAGVLSLLTWHVHFSRVALPVIWWPLFVLGSVALIAHAIENRSRLAWLAAGLVSGLGFYVYSAHWFFAGAVAVFLGIWLLKNQRTLSTDRAVNVALLALGAIVVALPMLAYIADGTNQYTNLFSRRTSPDWIGAGVAGRLEALIRWYLGAWNELVLNPVTDFGDGTGIVRPIPIVVAVAALGGLAVMCWKHRTVFSGLALAVVAVLPLGAALSLTGHVKHDLAIAPFVALAAGVGLATAFRFVQARLGNVGAWSFAAVIGLILALTSVPTYFGDFRDDPDQRWVFSTELAPIAEVINDVDGEPFINFASNRHPFNYEPLSYLLDGQDGSDRSTEFGSGDRLSLEPGVDRSQLFMLVGNYQSDLAALEASHPAGEVVDRGQMYVAYLVPAASGGGGG